MQLLLRKRTALLCSLTFLALAPALFAQPAGQDVARDSLKGLKGVRVAIDPLPAEAEKAGLERSTLQTDVELKLRTAGVPVLLGDRAFETPLDSYLQVRLTLVKGRFRTWAYSLSLQLVQQAKISNGLTAFASTWQKGEVGMMTTGKLGTLRNTVNDMANMFVNDYLAANQTPRSGNSVPLGETPRGQQED